MLINMDEVPFQYDMSAMYTYDVTGTRSINIRTNKQEK